ncbi:MAG: fumarate hydratase [Lentisphaerae bacterium]|nr:fumarate hydratase [Lentisphaerota bacterium]
MKKAHWDRNLVELIRRCATDLPADVELVIRGARRRERKDSDAHRLLSSILDRTAVARRDSLPLCQGTGTLTFIFTVPTGFDTNGLASLARGAVSKATRLGYLHLNAVDPISGAHYPTNVAHESPIMEFRHGARKTVDVRLMIKSGVCENMGQQYSLPDPVLAAPCELEGVRLCVLDAVSKMGAGDHTPGVLGVCIGGDRAKGYAHAKEQFLRKLNDRSSVKVLARLEDRLLRDSRQMGNCSPDAGAVGPILGVKIGTLSRLPESFFVSVSYMCWAFRRRGVLLGPEGGVHRWVY